MEWFAGHSVKNKHMPRLCHLGHSVHTLSISVQRNEIRRRRKIAIPGIVMNDLIVPDAFSCSGVQREQGIGKEVLPFPATAKEIRRCASGGSVNNSARAVNGHTGPVVRATYDTSLDDIFGPRIITQFTFARDGVEYPFYFARSYVERLNVSRRV